MATKERNHIKKKCIPQQQLLSDLGYTLKSATTIFEDNEGVIARKSRTYGSSKCEVSLRARKNTGS
jgi:hypothetical protein